MRWAVPVSSWACDSNVWAAVVKGTGREAGIRDEKGTIRGNDGMGEKCKDRWRRHRGEDWCGRAEDQSKQEVNIEYDRGAFETGIVGAAANEGRA